MHLHYDHFSLAFNLQSFDIIGKIMQIIEYNINTHIRTGIGKMLAQHFGAEKWVGNVVL